MIEATLFRPVLQPIDAEYIYTNESSLMNYTSLKTLLGLDDGTWLNDSLWLQYTLGNKLAYMAKRCVCTSIAYNTLVAAGLVEGKVITWGTKQYRCRLIRGTAQVYPNGIPVISDLTNYPANAMFSNAEFIRLIAPVLNKTGRTVEGIAYGTKAKFTLAQLGFQGASTGNSTMCAEHNSTSMLMRGSTDETFACLRPRTDKSTYWGFRPLLIEL